MTTQPKTFPLDTTAITKELLKPYHAIFGALWTFPFAYLAAPPLERSLNWALESPYPHAVHTLLITVVLLSCLLVTAWAFTSLLDVIFFRKFCSKQASQALVQVEGEYLRWVIPNHLQSITDSKLHFDDIDHFDVIRNRKGKPFALSFITRSPVETMAKKVTIHGVINAEDVRDQLIELDRHHRNSDAVQA